MYEVSIQGVYAILCVALKSSSAVLLGDGQCGPGFEGISPQDGVRKERAGGGGKAAKDRNEDAA